MTSSQAQRAWYFSLSSRLAALLPYLLSPRMGQPMLAMWARIWWVRPVISRTLSRASRPDTAMVSYSVQTSLAPGFFSGRICTLPREASLSR